MRREALRVWTDPRYSQMGLISRMLREARWRLGWLERRASRRWYRDFQREQARLLNDNDLLFFARGLGHCPVFRAACIKEAQNRGLNVPQDVAHA